MRPLGNNVAASDTVRSAARQTKGGAEAELKPPVIADSAGGDSVTAAADENQNHPPRAVGQGLRAVYTAKPAYGMAAAKAASTGDRQKGERYRARYVLRLLSHPYRDLQGQ
jgi:hypothetical protein